MKNEKIQVAILKELLKETPHVSYYIDEDDFVVVVLNGTVGYRMAADKLCVSLEGVQTSMALQEICDSLMLNVPLTPTDYYRKDGKARMYRADDRDNQPIYIDTGLLACFDHPQLYQTAYHPLRPVIVTETQIGVDAPEIVGIVMPVRVLEEE